MSQLEDADEIISQAKAVIDSQNNLEKGGACYQLIQRYYANYKPKDQLFEKFKYFMFELFRYTATEKTFAKFKKSFKEDLNGTAGLDELEEWILDEYLPESNDNKIVRILGKIQGIKKAI